MDAADEHSLSAEGYVNRYRNSWGAAYSAHKAIIEELSRRRGRPLAGVLPSVSVTELSVPVPLSRFQWPLVSLPGAELSVPVLGLYRGCLSACGRPVCLLDLAEEASMSAAVDVQFLPAAACCWNRCACASVTALHGWEPDDAVKLTMLLQSAGKGVRAGMIKCGQCKTCLNPQMKKPCLNPIMRPDEGLNTSDGPCSRWGSVADPAGRHMLCTCQAACLLVRDR